jgi:hypothetical protein
MALVPWSLSKIQHSIHTLIPINTIDTTRAENAMILDVLSDINSQNRKMAKKGAAHRP